MLTIETKEIIISDKLKRKIEMICKFANTTPIIKNGCIKSIIGTNIAYVMPHIVTIKGINYLIFDECDNVYINNLQNYIKLSDLENYIKNNYTLI